MIEGSRVKRYVDLSTIGSHTAVQIHNMLTQRNIVAVDSPVSGGVSGAENGTLAVMVSGPRMEFDMLKPALETIGRPFYIGEQPGSAQTMKIANNIMAATILMATSEIVVMGVKSGLDPTVMIDVLNAGSGATSASRDKFPRAILPRTFGYGFATGLMVRMYGYTWTRRKLLVYLSKFPRRSGGSGKPRCAIKAPIPIPRRRSLSKKLPASLWAD